MIFYSKSNSKHVELSSKSRPFKFLLYHRSKSIQRFDHLLTLLSINDIIALKLQLLCCCVVERCVNAKFVNGQKFIVPSCAAIMPVLW